MHFDMKQLSRVATAFVLAAVFALPQNLLAEGAAHVVSPSDLQRAAVQASTVRQQNVEQVRQFFSSEKAETGIALRAHEPGAGEERRFHAGRCGTGAAGLANAQGAG